MRRIFLVLVSLGWACAASAESSLTFRREASSVGDRLEQSVEAAMDLELQSRRGAEVLDKRASQSGRSQRRVVVATGLVDGRVTRASAQFLESSRTSDGRSAPEPVVGKTYHCVREDDQLVVTTADGATPTLAEYTVVARAMESLGRPNPLAEFLDGRTVAVGERIDLPPAVARAVMGLGDQLGEVERFTLTLREIERDAVGVFQADVEAAGAGSSQMRMLLGGRLWLDAATCRVVAADLSGPVGLMETRGSVSTTYQIQGTGRVRVAIRSAFTAGR